MQHHDVRHDDIDTDRLDKKYDGNMRTAPKVTVFGRYCCELKMIKHKSIPYSAQAGPAENTRCNVHRGR